MKVYRRLTAALAALILCLSLSTAAFATDVAAEPVETVQKPEIAIDFEGKSWDDVVDELLEMYNTSRYSISAAYINLVTGEEHFVNPDNYLRAASMYKLPLSMYFVDSTQGGLERWTTDYPDYDFNLALEKVLVNSNNDMAVEMCNFLGGYNQFRTLTAHYMGGSADTISGELFVDNLYNASDFANCLKLLYNESERFTGVLDAMQKAAQDDFFCSFANNFPVAHKFGYLVTEAEGDVYANDCGIVFSTQPIALVMFTKNVGDAKGLLGAYCSTMSAWAEYQRSAPAISEDAAQPTAPVAEEIVPALDLEPEAKPFPVVSAIAVLLFLVVALVLVIGLCAKYKLKAFWLLLAVLMSAATMGLAVVGMQLGTVYAKPSGDPQQSAVEFLDNICSGNYPAAYELLRDYADLGLEKQPETAAGKLAYQALHESFSYELKGECRSVKLDAAQPITFTYLDLTAIENAVVEETPNQLRRLVASRPMNEIYDANRNFLPAVTEEAYINAVSAVLENAQRYYTSISLELQLSYSDGRWQVLASPSLLKALNGGAGY